MRGHGRYLAARALSDGFDLLVACGGDGTAAEVLNGLMDSPGRDRAVLGVCPLGSGCDLARHFGLPRDPLEALRALSKARPAKMDAARVEWGQGEGRWFFNIVSLGLGGEIGAAVESQGKRFGGTLSYLLASLSALWRARPWPMALCLDGKDEPEAPYHLVAVANTQTTGGGMKIAPDADPADGLLDVVAVEGLSRWQLLRRLPSIYWGGHVKASGVRVARARTLEVRGPSSVRLNVDGESVGSLPARFTVLPAAVSFLVP